MKAYSQDVRRRVLRAIDQGKSQAVVAEMFAISTSTIKRYLKTRREHGNVLPKAIPGRPNVKGAALEAGLLEQLRAYPDATREQHCRMWEATHGIKVSPASITRARQALGWTRKKRP
jgi:transposase